MFDHQLGSSFFPYNRIPVMFTCQFTLEQLNSREGSVELKMRDKKPKYKLLKVSQSSLFQTLVCNTAFMQQIAFLNARKLLHMGYNLAHQLVFRSIHFNLTFSLYSYSFIYLCRNI